MTVLKLRPSNSQRLVKFSRIHSEGLDFGPSETCDKFARPLL